MDKGRIKRSVVTCAVLVGLSVSPQAQAGWLSDRWDDFTDSIDNVIEEVKDFVDDEIVDPLEEIVGDALEDTVVFLLQNGAGKGADYLIGLMLQLDGLDGHIIFDLLVDLMGNDSIITDQIMMEMMYNPNMVGLIEKSISAANTDAEKMERAREFFAVSVERFMPIMREGKIEIEIDKIPASVFYMFSNLGSIASNDDGLEKAWEDMLRSAMSSGEDANAFFGMLMQVEPQYQKAMLDFMFLGKTGDGQFHTAESVNFIQAMVEGMMNGLNQGTMSQEALGGLVQSLMPLLATFDAQGNMTGMTPYGMRFFTVVATKAMTCQDEASGQFAQMMAGMMPQGMVLPAVTNEEACGRVEDIDAIALINNGEVTYYDTDDDGVPDFMDQYPGIDNSADMDNDGIPDVSDPDIDGDDIENDIDADADGDGNIDDGKVDTDNDGIVNTADDDIDGDDIINDEDPDMDGDGIRNEADADMNGDGIMDNGPDTDNDGINDANDPDIDGDGIANDIDADADGDGNIDDGKVDTDGDGIVDSADADADGDGQIDAGNADADDDGVNDASDPDTANQTRTETIIYTYGEDGVLRKLRTAEPVAFQDYNNDPNVITNLVVQLPGNKKVIMQVDMDILKTDANGNRTMYSEILDNNGSRFIISMTTDGFGKVFIGNDQGGFEMSGNLAGMKENEELVFSVNKKEDGTLVGKTTIIPKDKDLTFGNSSFN